MTHAPSSNQIWAFKQARSLRASASARSVSPTLVVSAPPGEPWVHGQPSARAFLRSPEMDE
ncbi:MAG: hypothetical protein WCP70_07280 [Methanothrix sp.]